MTVSKVDQLINIARVADLRNRKIEKNFFFDGDFIYLKQESTDKPIELETPYSSVTCDCGNLLTIEDRGYRCRQCVLSDRLDSKGQWKKNGKRFDI